MMTTGTRRPPVRAPGGDPADLATSGPGHGQRPGAPAWSRRLLAPAAIVLGAGMALVVGWNGSPGWRAARVVAVALAVVALVGLAGHARPGRPPRAGRRAGATPPSIAAALAEAAVGTVALVAGATIAFSHLSAGVVSARAIGAVVAALGGLAAVAAGAAVLLLRVPRWWRVLGIPVVVALAYLVVVPLSTAVYATNVPRPSLGKATPASYGFGYEDVSFTTSDGVQLSGWYIPSLNRAAVALLHGASSTRSNVLAQAVVLARHGYGVLLFDARGHGRSGGRAMELGWEGDRDTAAALTYLEARPEVDPGRLGAVGLSMGGEEAIGALTADGRLRAVVAEGATNRTYEDKAWLVDVYGLQGRAQRVADRVTYGLADLLSSSRPPRSLRAAVASDPRRPVLLVTAGKVADEEHAARFIQAASPATVEVWTVPGASHTGGLRSRPGEWTRHVTGFLDRALLGAPVAGAG